MPKKNSLNERGGAGGARTVGANSSAGFGFGAAGRGRGLGRGTAGSAVMGTLCTVDVLLFGALVSPDALVASGMTRPSSTSNVRDCCSTALDASQLAN